MNSLFVLVRLPFGVLGLLVWATVGTIGVLMDIGCMGSLLLIVLPFKVLGAAFSNDTEFRQIQNDVKTFSEPIREYLAVPKTIVEWIKRGG